MTLARAIGAATAIGLLLLPAAAQATPRYASVTGAGTQCVSEAPCELRTAVEFAAEGDEVIVNPGTYTLSGGTMTAPAHTSVHGVKGAAKPVLIGTGFPILNNKGAGVTFEDLRFLGYGVDLTGAGSIADRIESISEEFRACRIGVDVTLRNSICKANGAGGAGVWLVEGGADGTSYLRNVTAVNTNPTGYGIYLQVSSSDTQALDMRGVIASGFRDLLIVNSAGGSAAISAFYSNWDTSQVLVGSATVPPAGSTTNQVAPPVFVNPAAGDYHQAPGSPTIDAGAADGRTGPLDVDGEARTQGVTADIGGDEFTVPAPPAPPAPPLLTADTTPPETTIGKGPKKKTRARTANFTLTSSESGSTFSCAVDKKRMAKCSTPFKVKGLKPGAHKLRVAATDAAGNADPTPAVYSWTVLEKPKDQGRAKH